MDSDGSNVRRLTNNLVSDYNPAWSDDGRRIVFTRGSSESLENGAPDNYLYTMDADGSNRKRRAFLDEYTIASWAPYGHQIVLSSKRAERRDLDWDTRELLYYSLLDNHLYDCEGVHYSGEQMEHFYDDPDWGPDGSVVVSQTDNETNQTKLVIGRGCDFQLLIDLEGSERGSAWSPDGSEIAFERSGAIYVIDRDGNNLRYIAEGRDPSWSPDGSKIAFESLPTVDCDDPCGEGIWVVDADGTDLVRIGDGTDPDWQPRCGIRGTPDDDVIIGTPGRDVICALAGEDEVYGLEGHDLIFGGRGDDRLFGGTGNDSLLGDAGSDRLRGDSGDDNLTSVDQALNDRVIGRDGYDRCWVDGEPYVREGDSCEWLSSYLI